MRRTPTLLAVPVLALGLALAGCSSAGSTAPADTMHATMKNKASRRRRAKNRASVIARGSTITPNHSPPIWFIAYDAHSSTGPRC